MPENGSGNILHHEEEECEEICYDSSRENLQRWGREYTYGQ